MSAADPARLPPEHHRLHGRPRVRGGRHRQGRREAGHRGRLGRGAQVHGHHRRLVRGGQLRHGGPRLPAALPGSWPNARISVMGGSQAAGSCRRSVATSGPTPSATPSRRRSSRPTNARARLTTRPRGCGMTASSTPRDPARPDDGHRGRAARPDPGHAVRRLPDVRRLVAPPAHRMPRGCGVRRQRVWLAPAGGAYPEAPASRSASLPGSARRLWQKAGGGAGIQPQGLRHRSRSCRRRPRTADRSARRCAATFGSTVPAQPDRTEEVWCTGRRRRDRCTLPAIRHAADQSSLATLDHDVPCAGRGAPHSRAHAAARPEAGSARPMARPLRVGDARYPARPSRAVRGRCRRGRPAGRHLVHHARAIARRTEPETFWASARASASRVRPVDPTRPPIGKRLPTNPFDGVEPVEGLPRLRACTELKSPSVLQVRDLVVGRARPHERPRGRHVLRFRSYEIERIRWLGRSAASHDVRRQQYVAGLSRGAAMPPRLVTSAHSGSIRACHASPASTSRRSGASGSRLATRSTSGLTASPRTAASTSSMPAIAWSTS